MTDVRRAPDEDARLYEELAPELLRFATALVGRADAPDVVSSAILRVLESDAWASVANRRAYLYRAVFNDALTWRKRVSQRRDRETRAAQREWIELPGFHPDVVTAVNALSTRQRAVVVLTYWADLTPAKVAEHLGISEGSVRRHLARARNRLREVLDDGS